MNGNIPAQFLAALKAGDFALCQSIIDAHGLDPTSVVDSSGQSALHICALESQYSIATILISQVMATRGTEAKEVLTTWVNKRSLLGLTSLHCAVFKDEFMLSVALLDIGADFTARTNSEMGIMHLAARGNSPALLVYFKEKYSMSYFVLSSDVKTPMHEAARFGSVSALLLLIACDENKTLINAQDSDGNTPLHLAITSFNSVSARLLLQSGADPTITNRVGQSSHSLAKASTETSIVTLATENKVLVECGVLPPISFQRRKWRLVICALVLLWSENALVLYYCLPTFSLLQLGLIFLFAIQQLFFILTIYSNPALKPNPQVSLLDLYQWNGKERVCPKCRIVRSPRIRHCPICDMCIARFDHHCPWVNNCIGAANLAYFLAFLVFTFLDIASVLAIIVVPRVFGALLCDNRQLSDLHIFSHLCIGLINAPLLLAIGFLILLQTQNFASNETTYERFSQSRSIPVHRFDNSSCWENCLSMCSQSEDTRHESLLVQTF